LRVDAALPDPVVELGELHVGAVDLVAGGGEVLPDRAEFGAAVVAVSQEPGGFRLIGEGAGAGVFAELVLEVPMDGSGFDEADQAVGVDGFLGPGGEPDREPPGGEVVDDGAAAVGFGDAVVDEALVHRQVGERPVLGQLVAGSFRRPYAVISSVHWSCGVPECGSPVSIADHGGASVVQSAASRSG
jgi:hypothetical protein